MFLSGATQGNVFIPMHNTDVSATSVGRNVNRRDTDASLSDGFCLFYHEKVQKLFPSSHALTVDK